jgi:hypothetical protein
MRRWLGLSAKLSMEEGMSDKLQFVESLSVFLLRKRQTEVCRTLICRTRLEMDQAALQRCGGRLGTISHA